MAVVLLERESLDALALIPLLVERFRRDDAVGPRDLEVGAAHPHLDAVRATPQVTERSADAKVDLANGPAPAGHDPHPSGEELRFRVGIEHQLARSVEDS